MHDLHMLFSFHPGVVSGLFNLVSTRNLLSRVSISPIDSVPGIHPAKPTYQILKTEAGLATCTIGTLRSVWDYLSTYPPFRPFT